MGGAWRGRAITAVGPYAAGALAVGTSMMTHATPFDTAVLLAEGAAISLLCGAVRTSRERERAHALGEAEARRCEVAARAAEAEARRVAEEARSSAEEAVRRAGAAFERAQTFREAQEVGRLKDEFLATVSHELRTPLNAILGWTTMLRRKPDVDTRKALDTIERNARSQMRLVEDVLDVSRAATGKLKIEPSAIDLVEVVRASAEIIAPTAEARGVALDVRLDEVPCGLWGDAERLRRAFWNVLSNAIKFTARGGRVAVRLARIGAHVEFVVADTGRGIHPDFLPHVFDRFRQADSSTTRAEGGLGLGLAIVKHIVELHGGTVSAQSRGEGYGATFTIALPVQALQAAPSSAPGRPPKLSSGVYLSSGATETVQGLSGIRVLVCDDDEEVRQELAAALATARASTRDAPGGCAALDAFREFSPHVFVAEIGGPHAGGHELIAQIRSMHEDEGGQTPAIALSAHVGRDDELTALAAGYQIHLAKPVDPRRFVEIVGNLVGRPLARSTGRPAT